MTSYQQWRPGTNNNPSIRPLLVWAVRADGVPQLLVTRSEYILNTPLQVLNTIDLTFSDTTTPNTTALGALTFDGSRFLLCVDHDESDTVGPRLYEINPTSVLFPLNPTWPAHKILTTSGTDANFVMSRGLLTFDIPGEEDSSTPDGFFDLLTLDSTTGRLITPLRLPTGLEVHGAVAGRDPLGTCYLSHGSTIGTFRMPDRIEPDPTPVAMGLVGDADNDGVAWTAADMAAAANLIRLEARSSTQFAAAWATCCKRNWDLNNDGVANQLDRLLYPTLYLTATPSSLCTQVSPSLDGSNGSATCP